MKTSIFIFLAAFSFVSICRGQTFKSDDINILYEEYVLPNGLRLIVHEDHKAPIVAVNIWYHVGSKNEKAGKSGFAHLFEHIMFVGSENYNDDYFMALESIGATDLNGTTNHDRTNYFQNVPASGLDQVLFLESDRMGHLLTVIDSAKLNQERGVVQNEKRQRENRPYGREYELFTENIYPEGHPYSWTVLGSMEDLDAASIGDVQEWFKSYYGPNNAVLVIAGDVKPDEVYEKVKKYFGHIPPGPTISKPQVWVAKRTEDTRFTYEDRVPEARIQQAWNVPEWGNKEAIYLRLASNILSEGKNSRLYKKLQYEEQVTSNVNSFFYEKEIGSNFIIIINVKPGESVDEVENKANGILTTFIQEGPTEEELQRIKLNYFAKFIKGLERIGGFGGKSDILAENAVYANDPEFYKKRLDIINAATIEDIKNAANKWLSSGKFTLICNPFPTYSASEKGVDRSKLPELGKIGSVPFPDIQNTTLKNGLEVVLAQREDVPTVVMNLLVNAGYASDQFGKPGTAALAMNLMKEGTKTLNFLEIDKKLQMLGASISTYSDLDLSYISMNTLKPTLDESLSLFADVILNPGFPEHEIDRLKEEQIITIKREKASPVQMAKRIFPKFLYGEGHAYSLPLTGSGYEKTVSSMTRADIQQFYSTWIKPENASLVVVGDIHMDELKQKLETAFAGWEKGDVPNKKIPEVTSTQNNVLYLLDKPESQQSFIIGGYLIEPYGEVSEIALETANNVLGGNFTARINMNLREDKHWSYGARSFIEIAKEQRPYLARTSVQSDKTKESIDEIYKEFRDFINDYPVTQNEFEKVKNNTVLQLPGRWETNSAVGNSINMLVRFDLDSYYWKNYDQKVKGLTLQEVRELSKKVIKPENFKWLVIGDKAQVLPQLENSGFEIVLVDTDGNVMSETSQTGSAK
jgi:zinc protease